MSRRRFCPMSPAALQRRLRRRRILRALAILGLLAMLAIFDHRGWFWYRP